MGYCNNCGKNAKIKRDYDIVRLVVFVVLFWPIAIAYYFHCGFRSMAKWKKDQKEFPISPFYDDRHECMIVIPKLVVEALQTPEKFVFKIKNKGIVVEESKK